MDKLPKIGNDSSTNKSNNSTGKWADKKSLDFSLGSTNSSLDSVNSGKRRCTRNLFLPNIHIADSITFSRNAPAMPLVGWMCVCSHVNYPAFNFCTECGYAKSAITNKEHYRSAKHTQFAVNNTAVDHHQDNLDSLEREERLSKSTPSFFPPINNNNSSRSESQTPKSQRNEEIISNNVNYNFNDDEEEEKPEEMAKEEEEEEEEEVINNKPMNNNESDKPVVTHAFDNDYVEHKVLLINNNQQQPQPKEDEEEEEKQQQSKIPNINENEKENNEEENKEIQQQQQEDYDQMSPKSAEDEQVENYVNDVLRQSMNEMKVEDVFDLESGRNDKNNEEKVDDEERVKEEDVEKVNNEKASEVDGGGDDDNEKLSIKGFDEVTPDDFIKRGSSISSRASSRYANFDDHLAFPQKFTLMVTGEKPQAVPISINLNLRPPSPPVRLSQFHLSKPNIENKAEENKKAEPPPALIGGLVIKETKTI